MWRFIRQKGVFRKMKDALLHYVLSCVCGRPLLGGMGIYGFSKAALCLTSCEVAYRAEAERHGMRLCGVEWQPVVRGSLRAEVMPDDCRNPHYAAVLWAVCAAVAGSREGQS